MFGYLVYTVNVSLVLEIILNIMLVFQFKQFVLDKAQLTGRQDEHLSSAERANTIITFILCLINLISYRHLSGQCHARLKYGLFYLLSHFNFSQVFLSGTLLVEKKVFLYILWNLRHIQELDKCLYILFSQLRVKKEI